MTDSLQESRTPGRDGQDNDLPRLCEDRPVITLRVGELAVVGSGTCLRTLLGSCVGIAIFDATRQLGGLAHVMLPSSLGHAGPPGKYVDTAIPELLQQLSRQGRPGTPLSAKLTGGASMLSTSSSRTIGEQNVSAAEAELNRRGIPVVGRHCGGSGGRRILFCTRTGVIRIEVVGAGSLDI